tara:strand:- start:13 stop:375 length:363 start_codon:yes stop_codon:yes gene_type:complete
MIITDIQESLLALGISIDKYILRPKNEIQDEASFKESYYAVTDVVDGNCVEKRDDSLIPVTWDQVVAKDSELKAANSYKTNREKSYPNIVDQLDTMYHQGFDAWKAQITAVKAKYPKPST